MAVTPLPQGCVMNVQMYGRSNGQRIINLFQYRAIVAPNPALDYFNYIDSLNVEIIQAQALRDLYLTCLGQDFVLDWIRYQPVFPSRLRFVDKLQGVSGLFPSGTTPTSNVAASIERWSRTGKRHGIGRVQLVCPVQAYTFGLITLAGYQTALFNLAQRMVLNISTTDPAQTWQPVICNTAAINPTTNVVEGAEYKSTVRTMHRRTVGLGV